MTHANLPAGLSLQDHTIGTMRVGDVAWTVPWAMACDAERRLWLDPGHCAHDAPGGTVAMRVWRDDSGWHVDASRCAREKKWLQREIPGDWLRVRSAVF